MSPGPPPRAGPGPLRPDRGPGRRRRPRRRASGAREGCRRRRNTASRARRRDVRSGRRRSGRTPWKGRRAGGAGATPYAARRSRSVSRFASDDAMRETTPSARKKRSLRSLSSASKQSDATAGARMESSFQSVRMDGSRYRKNRRAVRPLMFRIAACGEKDDIVVLAGYGLTGGAEPSSAPGISSPASASRALGVRSRYSMRYTGRPSYVWPSSCVIS